MVKVKIPTPLVRFTGDKTEINAEGKTIQELIQNLENKHPGIKKRLCNETGEVRKFINIYVDGEDIRFSKGLNTRLKENSEVSIVPAISGG